MDLEILQRLLSKWRPVREFEEFSLVEQVIFYAIAQEYRKVLPGCRIFAAGSRVRGNLSEIEIRNEEGTRLRKMSDFDVFIEPHPGKRYTEYAKILTDKLGVGVDLLNMRLGPTVTIPE